MKNIIIFGTTDFGRLMKYYIEQDDHRKVVAFTVNCAYINSEEFCGLPVIPFEELKKHFSPAGFDVLIAIGNNKMNNIRKSVFAAVKKSGYNVASFFHSSSSIHSKDIGEGNIILESCLVYPYSKIGCGNLLWDHILISHDCIVGDFNTFSSYADLCGYVHIGNNGYFGKHCILHDEVIIADYTLVGAAAYVKNNTKPYGVVVPPRSIELDHKISTDLM